MKKRNQPTVRTIIVISWSVACTIAQCGSVDIERTYLFIFVVCNPADTSCRLSFIKVISILVVFYNTFS